MNIFIFYRDLRIEDNKTLHKMMNKIIYPVFIWDENEWFSDNQKQFLYQTLIHLNSKLKKNLHIISKELFLLFIKQEGPGIVSIGWNDNYDRYIPIRKLCERYGIHVVNEMDMCLITDPRKQFRVYTPFYNYYKDDIISRPEKVVVMTKYMKSLDRIDISEMRPRRWNDRLIVKGGHDEGLKYLERAKKRLKDYDASRNCLYKDTSLLSAYLSLNVISIRKVYHEMKKVSEGFIKELFWREFFIHYPFHTTSPLTTTTPLPKLSPDQKILWEEWKKGKTGVPIVDACMNQLNITGYMHNRGRLIVSSYLLRDLKLPYQWGEYYFRSRLIDYNYYSNMGNWLWMNKQPMFKKLNPSVQNKKYDPNNIYIDLWLKK